VQGLFTHFVMTSSTVY